MTLFTIILIVFILLVFISLINPIYAFTLKLVTKEEFNDRILLIPSFLTLVVWFLSFNIMFKVLPNSETNFYQSLFSEASFKITIINIVFPTIITITIALLFQTLSLLTVNIDYIKLKNKTLYLINKKHDDKTSNYDDQIYEENQISTIKERYNLSFANSFITCLFIFSLFFFIIILLLFIGSSIGRLLI